VLDAAPGGRYNTNITKGGGVDMEIANRGDCRS
jgi:hypothetical protein